MNYEKLEVTKKSLLSLGLSEDEAQRQIEQVGKIVTMAIFERFLREKSPIEDITPQNVQTYLKDNFTAEYIQQVIEIESSNITQDYLKSVGSDQSNTQTILSQGN